MPLLAKDGAEKKERLINRTAWETGSLCGFPKNYTMQKFSSQLSEDCSHMFNWNFRVLNSASSFLTDTFYTAEGDALQY